MIVFWLIISTFAVAMLLLCLYAFRKERRVKKVYRIIKRTHTNLYDGVIPNADVAVNWIDQIQILEKIPTKELTEQHIYILLKLYQGLYLYATTGSVLHKPIAMPEEKLIRMLILRACFEKDGSFTFYHDGDRKSFYKLLNECTQEKQNTYSSNDTSDTRFIPDIDPPETSPITELSFVSESPTQVSTEPLEQQINRDKQSLTSLQEERDKLPTERARQWYEEGNITTTP